jgi:NADH dehydrogenase [ubiquinone] 1 alpha subcomplex assembly factor 8
MESVRKAKDRLSKYPILIAKCSSSATAYAVCVTRDLDVKKGACDKEFQLFRQCLVEQAKAIKTRL